MHGSALDEDEYMVSVRDAIEPLITNRHSGYVFWAYSSAGWIHAGGRDQRIVSSGIPHGRAGGVFGLAAPRDFRYLINPGSVGQPRDGDWRAAFAVFDSDDWIVSFSSRALQSARGAGENSRGEFAAKAGD